MILALLLTATVLFAIQITFSTEQSSGTCSFEVEEQYNFIKYVCRHGNKSYTKCPYSDEYYESPKQYQFNMTCSNDTYFYQACDHRILGTTPRITNSGKYLCGKYLCERNNTSITSVRVKSLGLLCDGKDDCENTRFDENSCSNLTTLPSGRVVKSTEICNDMCASDCEDEASCNGFSYGIYCKRTYKGKENRKYYVHPYKICDGKADCDSSEDEISEDEINCNVSDGHDAVCEKTQHDGTIKSVPVHNFTRCARFPGAGSVTVVKKYCDNAILSQSNCSDDTKNIGTCKVNGTLTEMSRHMICSIFDTTACDDAIDKVCSPASKNCPKVHKHYFCDGKEDCKDNSDETNLICNSQTLETCERRIGKQGNLTIPLTWLSDGIEDCIDGRDEKQVWPTCGSGKTRRFVSSNSSCKNVFLCPSGDPGYVELDKLCDGIETCGNENEVCFKSGNSGQLSTSVFTSDKGRVKVVSYCLRGLHELQLQSFTCKTEQFIFPDHEYYGVDAKMELLFPNDSQVNCDHLFGEQYVFTSCTNKCLHSSCPLKNFLRYESCPDQFQNRVVTLVNDEYLGFFTRSSGNLYSNRYFVCDNKIKCLDYSKVCDLVDDCGDASDEERCTNHFKCKTSRNYIPKTKVCDGRFDCLDLSDECNENCSNEILGNNILKAVSWFVGIVALLANLVVMARHATSMARSKNIVVLMNKGLIVLVALGDLLIGCYLISISLLDSTVFRNDYCHKQIDCVSSTECSVIGVLSTVGSQISLFAMTGLSIVRVTVIVNSRRTPEAVNVKNSIFVAVIMFFVAIVALAIAVIPIIGPLEDFFVNVIYFPSELKIFVGTTGKAEIVSILQAYYGKMKRKVGISWKQILDMVQSMYSHDFGYADHALLKDTAKKVHFYGNDGVCLFKYFVTSDDPQKMYVWSILALNFLCFIFISVSYILIYFLTNKGSNAAGKQQSSKRMKAMNRKIGLIIGTDFFCWIPFIINCLLHSLEIVDATPWYGFFSMVILPINSIINPFLYDDLLTSFIRARVEGFTTIISNSAASWRSRVSVRSSQMEMNTLDTDREETKTVSSVMDRIDRHHLDQYRTKYVVFLRENSIV